MTGALLSLALVVVASGPDFGKARARLAEQARAAGMELPLRHPELRVYKHRHRVQLWASGRLLGDYPVALGQRGLADKRREGDHLTPEGDFRICIRNSRSAFHLFLGISYPGPEAARRALAAGRISNAEFQSVLRAGERNSCPPWNTVLGGAVGLHGGGSGSDWTWGCIALEDEDIELLWLACPVGTPVRIAP